MAKYTCRVEGDKTLYPVLLSNGNLVEQGDLEGGKHYAVWEDPHKKPCYLFALVAGNLQSRDDSFVTRSGRKVTLRIWTPAKDLPKTVHAMYILNWKHALSPCQSMQALAPSLPLVIFETPLVFQLF
ncbi:hypothetical protein MKW94_018577 [Papaver nudicaule]|uniref:Uncharacterized protein n=1 Tax=Papaver nudicaule TaxID=74823 RepID=A0AA41V4G9_PAPNU|nr:hypothetical protein [Papaver nudicaule]